MNILVFSWRDPKHPLAGGAEQVMHEHMKGWVEKGHQVTLFTSFFRGAETNETLDGINIVRSGNQILQVHLNAFFWYLNHKNYDLVVDQFHGIPFFTPLYVKIKKLAVLQEVAREVWLKNDLAWPLNIIIGLIGYIGEPLLFLFYRNTPFMVGSLSAKQDLIKIGINKNKIEIVPHGVIVNNMKNHNLVYKENVITFLGALAKDKGIEDAIETFGILSSDKKLKFWVIGKGGEGYIQILKKICRRLGINEKVTFWGFVNQQKKFELLSKSLVLINPSLKEGWGLVNIEANAMGTPVVAYNSLGLIDSVKNNVSGILVKKNSPENLAFETASLIEDKKRLDELSKSAVKWSENFKWEKSKKLSLKLIENI